MYSLHDYCVTTHGQYELFSTPCQGRLKSFVSRRLWFWHRITIPSNFRSQFPWNANVIWNTPSSFKIPKTNFGLTGNLKFRDDLLWHSNFFINRLDFFFINHEFYHFLKIFFVGKFVSEISKHLRTNDLLPTIPSDVLKNLFLFYLIQFLFCHTRLAILPSLVFLMVVDFCQVFLHSSYLLLC